MAPISAAAAKAGAKRARILERAAALGITGDLGVTVEEAALTSAAPAFEREAFGALLDSARQRGRDANVSLDKLGTALTWLEDFRRAYPDRVLFLPMAQAGDLGAARHNEDTLQAYAEFIRGCGSKRGGGLVRGAGIGEYVSTLRAFRSLETGYRLLVPEANLRLPKQLRQMRWEDGPGGDRARRLGLRARHLQAAAAAGMDRVSTVGVWRWSLLVLSHNLLLRGGEVGMPDSWAEPDAHRALCWRDVKWFPQGTVAAPQPHACLGIVPIKDTHARSKRVPMLVCCRCPCNGREGVRDPLCAYHALRDLWLAAEAKPPTERGASLVFAQPDGRTPRTADVCSVVRVAAAWAGLDAADFGAHSLRIGGATDLYDRYGPAASQRIIQERGRWHSDIHFIYSRPSASAHLAASREVGDASGVDLESLFAGWSQPTHF